MSQIAKHKISIIGSGNIGGTVAHTLSRRGIYSIALLDINEGLAKGKALDISQSSSIENFQPDILGTSDPSRLAGSDIVIITAGVARKPGMTRNDLVTINSEIISKISNDIKKHCPNAFVIIITNPLDAMVYHLQATSNLNSQKTVGMAGVLDSARFCHFLAQELLISPMQINTMVLGGHGDSMVPLKNCTSISGIPLSDLVLNGMISQKDVDNAIQKTRDGGIEIVNLLKTGSAFYSPASSAIEMAESYLFNKKKILPCAAMLNGEYSLSGIYLGVPCVIDSSGVSKIIEVKLDNDEQKMLSKSVESVKSLISMLPK